MTQNKQSPQSVTAGYTLVEMAVVLIIIGIIIGGILKGLELVDNQRVTSTIAQVKAIDAAVSTFRVIYNALPGDMPNPSIRIPNCAAAPCSDAGNGDGFIIRNNEADRAQVHLAAAGLITGVTPMGTNGVRNAFAAGEPDYLGAAIGRNGAIDISSESAGTNGPGWWGQALIGPLATMPNGINLTIFGAASTDVLTPNQAWRIDNKLDDGVPGAGDIRARAGTPANCGSATAYLETNMQVACILNIFTQKN